MGSVRIGDIIAGKYRVERVLGTGGMGVVVAARHVDLGWLRAVKLMHPEPSGRQTWTHRFRREAQVGGRLHSPHAVRVFDVGGFDTDQPFIIMEHLEGMELGKLLRSRGPLPIDEAALYVHQACDAVAEAHDLGVVHRDLKPANLFVITEPDGRRAIKVLDFGISKAGLVADQEKLELTQTGEVFGSPAYMAPEQIRSFAGADQRSDMWSLGVILYELVTGRWPFPGKSSVEMIAMVLEQRPDPPSRYRPGLPPSFEAAILACLERDPARRTPNALALRDALQPFLPAPQVVQTMSDELPTLVAPQHLRPAPTPPPPPAIAAPVEAIEIEIAPPLPGPPTTSAPVSAMQTTLPVPAPKPEGPSTRVVVLVAAASLLIVISTLTALIRSAVPDTTAPAGSNRAAVASESTDAGAARSDPEPTTSAATPPPDPPEVDAGNTEPVAAQPEPTSTETAGNPAPNSAADPGRWSAKPAATTSARPADAPAGGAGHKVDTAAAMGAMASAASAAKRCKRPGGPTGSARVEVTFGPSGTASSVRVGGPFDGTPVGKCIVSTFRGASVPPFEGSSFSANKTVTIK